jgi:hypothetical protein
MSQVYIRFFAMSTNVTSLNFKILKIHAWHSYHMHNIAFEYKFRKIYKNYLVMVKNPLSNFHLDREYYFESLGTDLNSNRIQIK